MTLLPCLSNYKMNKFKFFAVQIALAVFLFCGLFLFQRWNPQHLSGSATLFLENKHDSKKGFIVPPKQKKALIIFTNHRAGSSFLGQFFNQRSDTFYVYEPLVLFGNRCQDEATHMSKLEHLRNFINCKIENQIDLFKRVNMSDATRKNLTKTCWLSNFCFRHKMKGLCTKHFCHQGNLMSCRGCEPVNTRLASRKCKAANIVVIKVIRMCSIEHLRPLLENLKLDVKIIHLIRDPRGIYNSRENLGIGNLLKSVALTCNETVNSWKVAVNEKDNWLKDRYKVVRYEDVCLNPLEMADQIYRFVGLSSTPAMKRWIETNSEGSLMRLGDARAYAIFGKVMKQKKRYQRKKSTKKRRFMRTILKPISASKNKIGNEKNWKTIIQNDPYTTTRNSSANWRKWTLELNIRTVSAIQESCRQALWTFDYAPIMTEDQLHTASTDFFYDFCPNNSLTFSKLTCNDLV